MVIGFVVRLVGARRYRPREAPPPSPEDKQPSTALVMPIYNESPERVVAGLRETLDSPCEQKTSGRSDLYLLSDTTDPAIWLAETLARQRLQRALAGTRTRERWVREERDSKR